MSSPRGAFDRSGRLAAARVVSDTVPLSHLAASEAPDRLARRDETARIPDAVRDELAGVRGD